MKNSIPTSIYLTHFLRALRRYIQFQLIATIVSLPILNAWGLPISVASLVGNMVLTPLLAFFLLSSSLVFFLDLIGFSPSWAVWCLETTSFCWYWCMEYAPTWALVSLPTQPIWLLTLLPLTTMCIVRYIPISFPCIRMISCILVLMFFCMYACIYMPPKNEVYTLSLHNKTMPLVYYDGVSCLIDTGALGCKQGTSIEYTLVPEIRKTIGSSQIDHLVLTRPGIFLFDTVAQLSDMLTIKYVHLLYWNDEKHNKKLGARYWNMKRCLEMNKVKLIRFGLCDHTCDHTINLTNTCGVTLVPLSGMARRNSLSWRHLRIITQIDKVTRELYDTSKQYQKNKK